MTDIPNARITTTEILIGGQPLPGPIEAHSISVTPGGVTDLNRLSVTFIVGRVDIDDPTA